MNNRLNEQTIPAVHPVAIFVEKLYSKLVDNAITIIVTASLTVLVGGLVGIWRLGESYYNLPDSVNALATKQGQYEKLLDEQRELNLLLKEFMLLQKEVNSQNKEKQDEQIRRLESIEDFLRTRQ